MKITVLSDLHGTLLPVEDYFEPCELVCLCGDIVPLNVQANSRKTRQWLTNEFKPWCESLPCDKVICIHSFLKIRKLLIFSTRAMFIHPDLVKNIPYSEPLIANCSVIGHIWQWMMFLISYIKTYLKTLIFS